MEGAIRTNYTKYSVHSVKYVKDIFIFICHMINYSSAIEYYTKRVITKFKRLIYDSSFECLEDLIDII